MKRYLFCLLDVLIGLSLNAQVKWINVDSLYQPLPIGFHVFKTTDSLDGKPFVAYYVIADLKNKKLDFTVDTTLGRRLTPTQFYEKNAHPLLVVNTTFFSFETNRNLNVVIKNGKLLGYNQHSMALKGKDTMMYSHAFGSAIGFSKRGEADIAWIYTDSSRKEVYASQIPQSYKRDSVSAISFKYVSSLRENTSPQYLAKLPDRGFSYAFRQWKMTTAVGGGPVLVQNNSIKITNEEENKFTGKAINDKHPRTLIGYTPDNKLIIMAIQGRFPNIAEGATLMQEARLMVELGCKEALNMDGGGSSCMLVNRKHTITPSDKQGTERAVPAVFIITN